MKIHFPKIKNIGLIFIFLIVFSGALSEAAESTHLNRYYHITESMRDPRVHAELLTFISEFDGTKQRALILKPEGMEPKKTFFFFHGMDGDAADAFVARQLVAEGSAEIISIGGRGASWLSDAFLSDAAQAIKKYSTGKDYYLIGISMGGTQVLALPGLLPEALKKNLRGVIALIPGSDLTAVSAHSASRKVRQTLKTSMAPEKINQRSPVKLLYAYPKGLPFAIFLKEADSILPVNDLNKFISELKRSGHPVFVRSSSGEHAFSYDNFDFKAMAAAVETSGAKA